MCGYPGTPSTEIVETAAALGAPGVIVQWCVNEKVAMETAVGAGLAGARSLVTMKHVGLNVAADPFMTLSLTGVNAGVVVLSADDPGMHSSQNEQDNRHYARFAKVPLLEPADSAEAYEYVAEAFALSEEADTPVMLRTTTRLSHGRGLVTQLPQAQAPSRPYVRDVVKNVMVPHHARQRNRLVLQRVESLRRYAESTPLNRLETGSLDLGIIASGVTYQHAREAFPDAWFLKLGMSWPLPTDKIARLYAAVSCVAVVEELDPFFEEQIRALGLSVVGKQVILADGELTPGQVRAALQPFVGRRQAGRRRPTAPPAPVLQEAPPVEPELPVRPPVLCPGCSHRAVFALLRRRKVAVLGDIGCYTLGALPPLNALESCLCMGASVGMMAGMNKVLGRKAAVAVLGDSTFFHSGVTPLIDARYNDAQGLVLVLDNRTTAMTGHQGHPGSGLRADGSSGPPLDIHKICQGVGVRCTVVDPLDAAALREAVDGELDRQGLGVVVASSPCVLATRERRPMVTVNADRCNLCGLCLELGCPALVPGDKAVTIDPVCTGCGVCVSVCKRGALSLPEAQDGR